MDNEDIKKNIQNSKDTVDKDDKLTERNKIFLKGMLERMKNDKYI